MQALPQLLMQAIYLGLALLHFSLTMACYTAIFNQKIDKGARWAMALVHLYALSNLFVAFGFLGSMIVTGTDPIRPRETVLPWIQLCWVFDALTLGAPVILGTWRGFGEMFNPVAKPGPVGDSNDRSNQ